MKSKIVPLILVAIILGILPSSAESISSPLKTEYRFNIKAQSLIEVDPCMPDRGLRHFQRPKGKNSIDTCEGSWVCFYPTATIHPPTAIHSTTLELRSDGSSELVHTTQTLVTGLPNPEYKTDEQVTKGRWRQVGEIVEIEL